MEDEQPTLMQKLKFLISVLSMNCVYRAAFYNHWDKIITGLYHGALPIESELAGYGSHCAKIIEQCQQSGTPLKLVISANLDFELAGWGLPFYPVSKELWNEFGVENIQIKIPDFTADVNLGDILFVMRKMHEVISAGGAVYTHCKAGVARSWMINMCYLTTYGGWNDIAAAEAYYQNQRPQVCPFNDGRRVIAKVQDLFLKYVQPFHKDNIVSERAAPTPKVKRSHSFHSFDCFRNQEGFAKPNPDMIPLDVVEEAVAMPGCSYKNS